MSGATEVEHTSRLVRVVFVEGISRNYARFNHPDGRESSPEMQAERHVRELTARLQWLTAALDPLVVAIARTQGGVPLTTADPVFAERKQTIDLGKAIGLSMAIYQLFMDVAVPAPLSDADRERLCAVARGVWKR